MRIASSYTISSELNEDIQITGEQMQQCIDMDLVDIEYVRRLNVIGVLGDLMYLPASKKFYVWTDGIWEEKERDEIGQPMAYVLTEVLKLERDIALDSAITEYLANRNIALPKELEQKEDESAYDQYIKLKSLSEYENISKKTSPVQHVVSLYATAMTTVRNQLFIGRLVSMLKENSTYVKTIDYEKMDAYLGYIPCEDNILEVKTLDVIPYSKEFMYTGKLEINATSISQFKDVEMGDILEKLKTLAPNYWNLISTLGTTQNSYGLPDEGESIRIAMYLTGIFGVALTGENHHRMFPIICGEAGSGKSTLLEVWSQMLGDTTVTSLKESVIMASSNDMSTKNSSLLSLKRARIVYINEVNEQTSLDIPLIKNLTGGDSISARGLFQNVRNFTFRGVIMMAVNDLMHFRKYDKAMHSRLVVFPITNTPEHQDRELKSKILETEKDIVIGASIAIGRMINDNSFPRPITLTDASNEALTDDNQIGLACGDLFIEASNERLSPTIISLAVRAYLEFEENRLGVANRLKEIVINNLFETYEKKWSLKKTKFNSREMIHGIGFNWQFLMQDIDPDDDDGDTVLASLIESGGRLKRYLEKNSKLHIYEAPETHVSQGVEEANSKQQVTNSKSPVTMKLL